MQASKKEPRYCRNCHFPLPPSGEYCSHCSQKYTIGKVTIRQLINEFFDAILNIDSKIFRTIGALFIPGKLTNEYFKGRHKRYMHPLRLFFIMAILQVAAISFLADEPIKKAVHQFEESLSQKAHQAIFLDTFDVAKARILAHYNNHPLISEAFDTLTTQFKDTRDDTLNFGYFRVHGLDSISLETVNLATRDMSIMETEELLQHYEIDDFWGKVLIGQVVKINREGASFSQFLIGKVIWMVLGMMIALAFILKLLYIRRKRYYVEHLIFSFHYHAFAFFVCSLGLFLDFGILKNSESWYGSLALLITLIYLFMAMRRVYKQRFFKTFFKYSFLNISYLFIFTLFLALTIVISAFLY